jgi:hypothetical protein
LQSVADSLGTIRGRKAVLVFTGGHPYQSENTTYIDAAVAAFNKANVAVHGISDDLAFANSLSAPTGGSTVRLSFSTPEALGKVADGQDAYYALTYTPPAALETGCHKVQVKVATGGLDALTRKQYCAESPQDPLAGKPAGKDLEARAAGSAAGGMTTAVSLPFFYTGSNRARVAVAVELVPAGMKFQKDKGRLVGELDMVGIAAKEDGSAGPRFSDVLKFAFENQDQADAFVKTPFHYEKQVEVPAGHYTFRLAIGSGDAFGKAQLPLVIEPWNPSQLALGGVAFGKARRAASTGLTAALDPSLLEGLVPLISSGIQVVPVGINRFSSTDSVAVYSEIQAPGGDAAQAAVTFAVRVLDRASGAVKFDTGLVGAARYLVPGSPVIPIVFDLPVKQVGAGSYHMEISATAGTAKAVRTADFDVN